MIDESFVDWESNEQERRTAVLAREVKVLIGVSVTVVLLSVALLLGTCMTIRI